jgi:hypothetical protein
MRPYCNVRGGATRAQVWDRWAEGLGLHEISRILKVRPIQTSAAGSSLCSFASDTNYNHCRICMSSTAGVVSHPRMVGVISVRCCAPGPLRPGTYYQTHLSFITERLSTHIGPGVKD